MKRDLRLPVFVALGLLTAACSNDVASSSDVQAAGEGAGIDSATTDDAATDGEATGGGATDGGIEGGETQTGTGEVSPLPACETVETTPTVALAASADGAWLATESQLVRLVGHGATGPCAEVNATRVSASPGGAVVATVEGDSLVIRSTTDFSQVATSDAPPAGTSDLLGVEGGFVAASEKVNSIHVFSETANWSLVDQLSDQPTLALKGVSLLRRPRSGGFFWAYATLSESLARFRPKAGGDGWLSASGITSTPWQALREVTDFEVHDAGHVYVIGADGLWSFEALENSAEPVGLGLKAPSPLDGLPAVQVALGLDVLVGVSAAGRVTLWSVQENGHLGAPSDAPVQTAFAAPPAALALTSTPLGYWLVAAPQPLVNYEPY